MKKRAWFVFQLSWKTNWIISQRSWNEPSKPAYFPPLLENKPDSISSCLFLKNSQHFRVCFLPSGPKIRVWFIVQLNWKMNRFILQQSWTMNRKSRLIFQLCWNMHQNQSFLFFLYYTGATPNQTQTYSSCLFAIIGIFGVVLAA